MTISWSLRPVDYDRLRLDEMETQEKAGANAREYRPYDAADRKLFPKLERLMKSKGVSLWPPHLALRKRAKSLAAALLESRGQRLCKAYRRDREAEEEQQASSWDRGPPTTRLAGNPLEPTETKFIELLTFSPLYCGMRRLSRTLKQHKEWIFSARLRESDPLPSLLFPSSHLPFVRVID